MKLLNPQYIFKCFILGLVALLGTSYAADDLHQKHLESISNMIESGVLSEDEGKEQIALLKLNQVKSEQKKIDNQSRGIASTLTEQKIIEFSNDTIEIQVK